jgi:hypothetical protein
MWKKIALTTLLTGGLVAPLFGETLIGTYVAKYGIFGKVAKATGTYQKEGNRYRIFVDTRAVGMVASLSKHLRETFESKGKVVKGVLVPDTYTMTIKRGSKFYKYIYKFDRKKYVIYKLRYFNGKLEYNRTLPYWVNFDVLSLYFSLPHLMKPGKKRYTFYALGARKSDGRLDVSYLTPSEKKDLIEEVGGAKNALYLKFNLYNKVFAGDRGILYLVISKDNFVALKGLLKNVLKVGDLKGYLTSLRYSK